MRTALIGALLALPVALEAQQAAPPACDANPDMAVLDFWVGSWDVFVGDNQVGTNRIEKILGGCAITETWRDAGGGEGRSLFYFDPVERQWRQVWVTPRALIAGGMKEKSVTRILGDGSVVFLGRLRNPANGLEYLDRTTLTPMEGGRVRQVIQISTDGGTTWQPGFDAIYVPAGGGDGD